MYTKNASYRFLPPCAFQRYTLGEIWVGLGGKISETVVLFMEGHLTPVLNNRSLHAQHRSGGNEDPSPATAYLT